MRQLGSRSEVMLVSLRDNSSRFPEGKLQDSVEACVKCVGRVCIITCPLTHNCSRTLTFIRDNMIGWASLRGINAFLMQDVIVKGIKESHQALTDCYNNFIVSHYNNVEPGIERYL